MTTEVIKEYEELKQSLIEIAAEIFVESTEDADEAASEIQYYVDLLQEVLAKTKAISIKIK